LLKFNNLIVKISHYESKTNVYVMAISCISDSEHDHQTLLQRASDCHDEWTFPWTNHKCDWRRHCNCPCSQRGTIRYHSSLV